MSKIPYFIEYIENVSITDTDYFYFDNNTNIAQTITYADLKTQLESELVVTATTYLKPTYMLMGC